MSFHAFLRIVAVLALPATYLAAEVFVFDTGTKSGGNGLRHYSYRVVGTSDPIMQFRVGVNDTFAPNYSGVLVPAGWSFEVVPTSSILSQQVPAALNQSFGAHTRTGDINLTGPGIAGTRGFARWYTTDPALAVDWFHFGFNHDLLRAGTTVYRRFLPEACGSLRRKVGGMHRSTRLLP